nr:PREDICTED: kinesin-like protein KIF24 isoform X2 [Lepisosteus oculatus]
MASCLYECLCEAGLERYYPQFTALGLRRPANLSRLTMSDYPRLGVHHMQDRTRLFHLVQLVKTLQDGQGAEEEEEEDGSLPARGTPRRQLDFSTPSGHSTHADSVAPRRRPGQAGVPHSLRCPAKKEQTPLHRVTHSQGYNYGLPLSSARAGGRGPARVAAERIRVCVRKRPLRGGEERRGELDVVDAQDHESVLVHEKKEAVDLSQYTLQHVFYFDDVFGESCTNEDVYRKTAYPLIQHVFNGGKATCFAYGQTGAGKTHTMMGTARSPGLYALAARDLFARLGRPAPARGPLHLCISFFEIYCGQLYDLLDGRKRLFAREDGRHVVQIVGLREERVESVGTLLEVISWGSRERSRGASGVNADSSRSHAVIQIHLKDSTRRLVGRISFIDLAGSERAADTRDPDRQTKMEGAEINQSLLALKECIRALDQEHSHTPFRQSKLTQVLKDSFIGNSKTCMIANISPSHVATEHTLNTLRYADRVKELRRGVKHSPGSRGGSRLVGSPFSKRNKHSCRERSSPKKLRLGAGKGARDPKGPHPGVPVAVVTPPRSALLCSTPKTVAVREAWLKHSSPAQGMLRAAEQKEGDKAVPKGQCEARCRQEQGLGSQGIHKVQAMVWPVWKETVARERFKGTCLGRASLSEDRRGQVDTDTLDAWAGSGFLRREREREGGREKQEEDKKEAEWETLCHRQRERELGSEREREMERQRHLRKYHQQLQRPSIRHYQPLEGLLASYEGQSMDSLAEPGVRPSSRVCPGDTDVDSASDASQDSLNVVELGSCPSEEDHHGNCVEDAYSPGYRSDTDASVRRGRSFRGVPKGSICLELRRDLGNRERADRLQGEYRSREDWQEQSVSEQREEAEETNPSMEELEVSESWRLDGRTGFGDWLQDSPGQPDWSIEEDSFTMRSSGSNNTPEKPYSPVSEKQPGHVSPSLDCFNNLSSDHKQINSALQDMVEIPDLSNPKDCTNVPLPSDRNFVKPGSDGEAAPTCDSMMLSGSGVHAETDRDSASEPQEDNSVHQQASDISITSATMDPLTISLLDIERQVATDSFLCGPQSPSLSQGEVSREESTEDLESRSTLNQGPAVAQRSQRGQQTQPAVSLDTPLLSENGSSADCHTATWELCPQRTDVSVTLAARSLISTPRSFTACTAQHLCNSPCQLSPSHASNHTTPPEDSALDHGLLSPAATDRVSESAVSAHFSVLCRELAKELPGQNQTAVARGSSPESDRVTAAGAQDPTESCDISVPAAAAPVSWSSQELVPSVNVKQAVADLYVGGLPGCHRRLRNEVQEVLGLRQQNQGLTQSTSDTTAERNSSPPADPELSPLNSAGDQLANPTLYQGRMTSPTLLQHTVTREPLYVARQQQEALGRAQSLVIRAHREELDEMQSLSRREEALLSLQPDMDFTDYVVKLEEIMELKAKCVRSVRAQLQLYLTYPGATGS